MIAKTVTPSSSQRRQQLNTVNTRCESVDKGQVMHLQEQPPLFLFVQCGGAVLGQAPPSFQENGCQLIEGAYGIKAD